MATETLLDIITYAGAFKFDGTVYGSWSADKSQGGFCLNAAKTGFFICGQRNKACVGEFTLLTPDTTTVLADLPEISATEMIQGFEGFLPDKVTNTEDLDRINGLYLNGSQLVMTAYEYYGGPNDNNILVLEDATDLATGTYSGFYQVDGRDHVAHWISPVPAAWQATLGGDTVMGAGSGMPIAPRNPIGPTFWVTDIADVAAGTTGPSGKVTATACMDFSLSKQMTGDNYNELDTNDCYTVLSWPSYGFIVPGTDTYMVVGHSGGHDPLSHVGYKIYDDENTNTPEGGPAPHDHTDRWEPYYWLFDMNDIVEGLDGTRDVWDLYPYEYGHFPATFQTDDSLNAENMGIFGGHFEPSTNMLYLVIAEKSTGGVTKTKVLHYDITDFTV